MDLIIEFNFENDLKPFQFQEERLTLCLSLDGVEGDNGAGGTFVVEDFGLGFGLVSWDVELVRLFYINTKCI
jgi:hypothetical protein